MKKNIILLLLVAVMITLLNLNLMFIAGMVCAVTIVIILYSALEFLVKLEPPLEEQHGETCAHDWHDEDDGEEVHASYPFNMKVEQALETEERFGVEYKYSTEEELHNGWRSSQLPGIITQEDRSPSGKPDYPLRQQSWNDWLDAAAKFGYCDPKLAEVIDHPAETNGSTNQEGE